MIGRKRLLLVTVVALLTVGFTAGIGTAAPEERDCAQVDGENRTVIAEYVDGTPYDDEAVYSGTQLELVLCDNGAVYGGEGWLDDGVGFEIRDEYEAMDHGGYVYEVEVTSDVDFGDQVAFGSSTGPDVDVRVPTTYTSDIDGIDRLVFADNETRAKYETLEADFLENRAAVDEQAGVVAAAATEIDADSYSVASLREAADEVETLTNRTDEMTRSRTDLAAMLGTTATTGSSNASVGDIRSIRTSEQETMTAVNGTIEEYEAAVETEESTAVSTLRTHLGGAVLLGAILGLVGGAVVPLRVARSVEESIQLDSDVEYDRKAVVIPIVVGLALLAVGLVIVAMVGGSDLLEVIA